MWGAHSAPEGPTPAHLQCRIVVVFDVGGFHALTLSLSLSLRLAFRHNQRVFLLRLLLIGVPSSQLAGGGLWVGIRRSGLGPLLALVGIGLVGRGRRHGRRCIRALVHLGVLSVVFSNNAEPLAVLLSC
jgi:hypothetical protein